MDKRHDSVRMHKRMETEKRIEEYLRKEGVARVRQNSDDYYAILLGASKSAVKNTRNRMGEEWKLRIASDDDIAEIDSRECKRNTREPRAYKIIANDGSHCIDVSEFFGIMEY